MAAVHFVMVAQLLVLSVNYNIFTTHIFQLNVQDAKAKGPLSPKLRRIKACKHSPIRDRSFAFKSLKKEVIPWANPS